MDYVDMVPNSAVQQLNNATSPKDAKDNKKMAEAAAGFEAYFIQQMLTEMRKTIPKAETSGFGSAIYESMFDQALAQKMSENSGLGLAKQIQETLKARSKE